MRRLRWMVALGLTASGVVAGGAGAAEVKLGLNSSAGLGCQIAGVRAGVQTGRLGLYAQGAYCASNVQGQSGGGAFGAVLTVDLFTTGNLSAYALAGAEVQGSNTALHGGLGLRYGLALLPVEAYVEAGAQRISTALQPIVGPRVAVGVNYRIPVAGLQGQIPAPLVFEDGNTTQYAGSAPAECKLTQEQDIAAARGAATSAANDALSAAAGAYGAVYSGVGYRVEITSVGINGNSARVGGKVTVSATGRDGKSVGGTYGGTVTLVRDGCGWNATGYTRS